MIRATTAFECIGPLVAAVGLFADRRTSPETDAGWAVHAALGWVNSASGDRVFANGFEEH